MPLLLNDMRLERVSGTLQGDVDEHRLLAEHPQGSGEAGDSDDSESDESGERGLGKTAGHQLSDERELLSKLDWRIVPLTALLYLAAYLDRSNLGNARLQGLQEGPLAGSDTAFSIALCSFFATYILFSIPGTLLANAIGPSKSIGIGALLWSFAAMSMSAANNLTGIVICRLLVGTGEAMFGQAVALYFSIWYRKDEIARRLAFFVGAGTMSGVVGGLIAFAVSSLHHSGVEAWRMLFFIEGAASFIVACAVIKFLPTLPASSTFINEKERILLLKRLKQDTSSASHGLRWSGVHRALTNPWAYLLSAIYSAMNLCLGSVSGFLPSLLLDLGVSRSQAQLLTVPLYATAFGTMLLLSIMSDRYHSRGAFAAIVFAMSLLGWLVLLLVHDNLHIRYLATFLVTSGGYCAIPLLLSWCSNNCANESQRAVQLGMLNTIGQMLSVLAAFSFPTNEGPRYIRGTTTNVVFSALALILSMLLSAYFRNENERRDRASAVGTTSVGRGELDLHPGFRYVP